MNITWNKGYPPKIYGEEWFLAKTSYGPVVLISLPKTYSYDYKTADETYIMKEQVQYWMQLPDSEYKEYKQNILKDKILDAQKTLGYSVFQEMLDIIDGEEDANKKTD